MSIPLFGDPRESRGYVAIPSSFGRRKIFFFAPRPTFGPLLILPLALKPWGSPRRQGLCRHLAHLWATSDFAPGSEAVGFPKAAGVM